MSIGDWGGISIGKGSYQANDEVVVAKQFATTAENLDAQFVINVGDNFYYWGVFNVSDERFNEDYEDVFTEQSTMVKWYSVLGNHDYGWNPQAQVEYVSPNNNRWVMDSRYYTRRVNVQGDTYITFIFLDTNPCISAYRSDDPSNWDPCNPAWNPPASCKFHANIMKESCPDQYSWLQETVKSIPSGDWVIGVGHHPAYEIDVNDLTGLLIDAKMDLYLNGHSHMLTQYTLNGAGAYVTTGAGSMVKIGSDAETMDATAAAAEEAARTEALKTASDQYQYTEVFNEKVAGFTYHQFNDDLTELTTNFVDYTGKIIHSFTINKSGNGPSNDGSCKKFGCGTYKNSCACNSYCEKYGDCCPDYKSTCVDYPYGNLRH